MSSDTLTAVDRFGMILLAYYRSIDPQQLAPQLSLNKGFSDTLHPFKFLSGLNKEFIF